MAIESQLREHFHEQGVDATSFVPKHLSDSVTKLTFSFPAEARDALENIIETVHATYGPQQKPAPQMAYRPAPVTQALNRLQAQTGA